MLYEVITREPGEPELTKDGAEVVVHGRWLLGRKETEQTRSVTLTDRELRLACPVNRSRALLRSTPTSDTRTTGIRRPVGSPLRGDGLV